MNPQEEYKHKLEILYSYLNDIHKGDRDENDVEYLALKEWLKENFNPDYIGILL